MNYFYFFLGVSCLQFIYVFLNYLFFKRKEFIYYLVTLLMAGIFVFIKSVQHYYPEYMHQYGESMKLGDKMLLVLCAVSYLKFFRNIIQAEVHYPKFNRQVGLVEKITLVFVCICFLMIGFKLPFSVISFCLISFYMLFFPIQLYIIFFIFKQKDKIGLIILLGSICFMLPNRISIMNNYILNANHISTMMEQNYIMTGLMLNFLFLNFALILKSKQFLNEKIEAEVLKRDALYDQRISISRDLHDDAGATLSSLYVYSALTESAILEKREIPVQYVSKIKTGIARLMENMNDIIWAMQKDNGPDRAFSSMLKDFYYEPLAAKGIECTYAIEPGLEAGLKNMEVRKNLLLITKEAINNILKHSEASAMRLTMETMNDSLQLIIHDNGKGISTSKSGGNGLENMKKRAHQINGSFSIESHPNKGTEIVCNFPLAIFSD